MTRTRLHRPARRRLALALLAGGLFTVGCTDGSSESATTTTVAGDDALREYAACMREHGVDLPDGGAVANGAEPDAEEPAEDPDFEEANDACEDLLGDVVVTDGSAEPVSPEAMDALVAYAGCMREHGVDVPDPSGGGLVAPAGEDDLDVDSQEFRDADEACRDHLTDAGIDVEQTEGNP